MSVWSIAFGCLFAAMIVGAAVQGSVGMGLSLITVPVGAIVYPASVPGVFVVAGLPLSLLVVFHERHHIHWSAVRAISIGRVPGAVIGTVIVVVARGDWIAVAAGVVVLLGAAVTAKAPEIPQTTTAAVAAGCAAGITGTAAGIDGPPMALYLQHEPAATIRGTLAACFIIGTTISATTLTAAGKLHLWQVKIALSLVPAVVFGQWIARRHLIPHVATRSRTLVLTVATIAGLSAIVRAIIA